MKFKLYLELASRVRDAGLLCLLGFPDTVILKEGQWAARWWSHGKTKRMRSADRGEILRKIAADGVNELDLTWRLTGQAASAPLSLAELWAPFTPSRTSALWAPVPTERLKSPQEERVRKRFGAGKPPQQEGPRLPLPSTLECFLTFDCEEKSVPDVELQTRCVEWFLDSLPAGLDKLDYFGYGCVHESCRMMNMVDSMGGVAAWTDQLGEKFENIYPILIGPLAPCEGLAAALGDRCSLIRTSDRARSAVVSIPPDRVEEIRQDSAVRDWVVVRDLSKLDAPPATLDEIYRRNSAIPAIAPFTKR
jgi:hypothetical protein